jgi:hypothetical protein
MQRFLVILLALPIVCGLGAFALDIYRALRGAWATNKKEGAP